MMPRPVVAPPAPWSFPVPEEHHLPNGTRLLAYQVPGQHVLSVRHIHPAPLAAEPRHLEGVAQLAAHSLDEGTRSRSSEQLAEAFEAVGADFGAWVSETALGLELDVVGRQLRPALELALDCLIHPAFHPEEVARQARARLADIDLDRAYPSSRVALELAHAVYPETDRASRARGGSRETVAAITADDVAAFHARHLSPAGATVIVAGDLRGTDVAGDVAGTFGSWGTGGGITAPPVPWQREAPAPAGGGPRIVLVDRPGAVQTELAVAGPGPTLRDARGWAPYPVLAFLLGGGPTARIDAVLREEKGYTYGLRAGFRSRVHTGLFTVSGSVRGDVTVPALELLLETLDTAGTITAEELERGVAHVARTAPGRFATASAVADEAVALVPHGLSTEHTTGYLRALPGLTVTQVREAWDAWRDGTWTVVLSGDADAHAEGLRALGRGEVEVLPG